jgi:spore coat polysaccharide biosynthesis predicted glycosyltransferase SpsG
MTVTVDFIIDCGPRVGMGHLSRSTTLAHALQARGAAVRLLVTDSLGAHAPEALQTELLTTALFAPADIVIVDGLRFSAEEVDIRRPPNGLFVVIDDLGDRPVACDVLVNQNIYGDRLGYAGYQYESALLGPKWALIKEAFAAARDGVRRIAPRALLTFGGGVTGAVGIEVARLMAPRFAGPIDVALGALSGVPDAALPANVTVHRGGDMPDLMAQATLYVGSLGVTFLEALAAGLPAIAVCVVDNQKLALDAARDLGVTVFETPDAHAITQAALAALADPHPFVLDQPDGHGAARTAEALLTALSAKLQRG